MKLEVVVVPVADVDRAKNFYKALGWQPDPDWPDWYAQYMVDERNAQAAGT